MSFYILIHGSWHGGWCWNKVATLLEQAGHKVIAPNLPSHGDDRTSISEVTLQSYVDYVCKVIEAQTEPVILVGHSMAGIVISQVAEQCPAKIKKLVYLSAFLLKNGESAWKMAPDLDSLLLPKIVMSEDCSYITVKDEFIKDIFYGDCSDEDVRKSKSQLVPEAIAPLDTPVRTTAENFGRSHRVYIECLQDRAISISQQRKMQAALPCQRVIRDLQVNKIPIR
jgi:pimeloyl-ACP methyl ester carboxylesterase